MNMDTSKKILNIAAVINFISGIPTVILGVIGLMGTQILMNDPKATEELGTQLGEMAPAAPTLMYAVFGIMILSGVLTIVEGILNMRAVRDPEKIMPVWYLSIVLLVLNITGVISSAMSNSLGINAIVNLVMAGTVFYAANSIKEQLGK